MVVAKEEVKDTEKKYDVFYGPNEEQATKLSDSVSLEDAKKEVDKIGKTLKEKSIPGFVIFKEHK